MRRGLAMIDDLPILGICGWSGSGKTTLIEKLLPILIGKGLAVAVVKHDAHGIDIDRPGKDSDRFFQAGADVLVQGPDQSFFRTHRVDGGDDWAPAMVDLASRCDLVLVEGHKSTDLPKVWLLGENETAPPPEVTNISAVLPWNCDRVGEVGAIAESYLTRKWLATPVYGCVLIGGRSTRMGTPKHLLPKGGKTWLETTAELMSHHCRQTVISGTGDVPDSLAACPRLPDVPNAAGPMSGILAAMRWAPHASCLVAACDLPDMTEEALSWLLSTRTPGVWATVPRLPGSDRSEPLLAHYDFRSRRLFEDLALRGSFRLGAIASYPKVASPVVPPHLASSWHNVNAPGDLSP